MAVHEVYAQIYEGNVVNTVVGDYTSCNQAAREVFGPGAYAIEVTQIPTQIGDRYRDGMFFRVENGVERLIEAVPTDSNKIDDLLATNKAIRAELDTVSLALLDLLGMEG